MRMLGFALIVMGGWGISLHLVREMKQNISTWVACGDFVRYIRLQIDCFLSPQDQIFHSFSHPILEGNGLLPALRSGEDMEVAVKGIKDKQLADMMLRFGRELGQGYREEQLRVCDFYLAQMVTHRECEEEKMPSQIKIKRTVCMVGAMLVGLLFL